MLMHALRNPNAESIWVGSPLTCTGKKTAVPLSGIVPFVLLKDCGKAGKNPNSNTATLNKGFMPPSYGTPEIENRYQFSARRSSKENSDPVPGAE
jgi:hypothetical protein